MNEIKLKPCPFCGGEARLTQYYPGRNYSVQCSVCGAITLHYTNAVDAARAWNRRVDNKPIRQSCKSCKHYTPDPNYRDGNMGNCRYLAKIWEKPFYVNEARTECEHFQAAERINENGNET